ncbi:hypothetical protein CEXT_615611 [Caerostris extrusa]|uniref:Uncharacterized protein n=1 Tax=Caerostris extrusa TaxID=172846 RepID=A0AAV4U8Z8_CAEEX|nr:hypothetical protein CEXT_615611 [Caerostris extrusa]
MTVIDRFIRWPEVVPTYDISAETSCRVLISGWVFPIWLPFDHHCRSRMITKRRTELVFPAPLYGCCQISSAQISCLHHCRHQHTSLGYDLIVYSYIPVLILRSHGKEKTFIIIVNGKYQTVSIDRLKPAFFLCNNPTVCAEDKGKNSR